MAFTTLLNVIFGIDKPITSSIGLALRDNPLEIAAGNAGAPYVQSSWHPYNGVKVDDGNTGRVWSFAVDGAVAAFETPDFIDGYEYRLLIWGLSPSLSGNYDVNYTLRRQSDGALNTPVVIVPALSSSGFASFAVETVQPRRVQRFQIVNDKTVDLGAASAIKNIRISLAAGPTFDAGEAYLQRRRVYA